MLGNRQSCSKIVCKEMSLRDSRDVKQVTVAEGADAPLQSMGQISTAKEQLADQMQEVLVSLQVQLLHQQTMTLTSRFHSRHNVMLRAIKVATAQAVQHSSTTSEGQTMCTHNIAKCIPLCLQNVGGYTAPFSSFGIAQQL